jgi:alpha-N-acetylglucosamine transferase
MTDKDAVDWSKYAYVLYATSSHHMCNSMMIFAELRKFNTRAQLVLLVKQEFLTQPDNFTYEHGVLTNFSREYDVKLKPTELIQMGGDSVNIWLSSFTKLLVFNETEYERIIYMDSDALLLRDNFDELFFIPPCKMAVSTAYWHTTKKFKEMGNEKILHDYPPTKYGFRPITAKKRAKNLLEFIQDKITTYLNPETGLLPVVNHDTHSAADEVKAALNKKNFYTNVYNSLPNYPTLKEFDLTNIVMVIEPTPELFDRVLLAMKNKRKDEYDMELVQYHMFDLFDNLARQQNKSLANAPHLSFEERFEETPEFLISPHQVYGTTTRQLNSDTTHFSWMADAHEQIFSHLKIPMAANSLKAYYDIDEEERVGDLMYDIMKYAHFTDAPIPKPWFEAKHNWWYMKHRTRCASHQDFSNPNKDVVRPGKTTRDCSPGEKWEQIRQTFKETRKSVCGLDLISTDEDTYYKIIN